MAIGEAELNERGEVIRPGDERYDDARAIYNAMIGKRPAVIAHCVDAGT